MVEWAQPNLLSMYLQISVHRDVEHLSQLRLVKGQNLMFIREEILAVNSITCTLKN